MKRLALLIVMLLLPALAHTTALTGRICDASSTPGNCNGVNGTIAFQLNVPAMYLGTPSYQVVPTPITFKLNNGQIVSSGVGAAPALTGNDVLQPANTVYWMKVKDMAANTLLQIPVYVGGTSFDIGAAIPTNVTTNQVYFSMAQSVGPAGPQGPPGAACAPGLNCTGSVGLGNGVQVVDAALQTGADFCAKVNTAFGLLPASGGTVDTRGLTGAQTCAGQINIPGSVTIIQGASQLQCTGTFPCVTSNGIAARWIGQNYMAEYFSNPWWGSAIWGANFGGTLVNMGGVNAEFANMALGNVNNLNAGNTLYYTGICLSTNGSVKGYFHNLQTVGCARGVKTDNGSGTYYSAYTDIASNNVGVASVDIAPITNSNQFRGLVVTPHPEVNSWANAGAVGVLISGGSANDIDTLDCENYNGGECLKITGGSNNKIWSNANLEAGDTTGNATATGGNTTLTWVSGAPFNTDGSWVGKKIGFPCSSGSGIGGCVLANVNTIAAVSDSHHLTTTTNIAANTNQSYDAAPVYYFNSNTGTNTGNTVLLGGLLAWQGYPLYNTLGLNLTAGGADYTTDQNASLGSPGSPITLFVEPSSGRTTLVALQYQFYGGVGTGNVVLNFQNQDEAGGSYTQTVTFTFANSRAYGVLYGSTTGGGLPVNFWTVYTDPGVYHMRLRLMVR